MYNDKYNYIAFNNVMIFLSIYWNKISKECLFLILILLRTEYLIYVKKINYTVLSEENAL